VIAVDLRGTGSSSASQTGYDTAQLADDVHKLLTRLNLHKGVQIVAHDIGAWIAYPYAAMWPTEVSRMVVMEGPIPDRSLYTFPALRAARKRVSKTICKSRRARFCPRRWWTPKPNAMW
jgi:pimeloyl-ACP methyl ester carboxylesterase